MSAPASPSTDEHHRYANYPNSPPRGGSQRVVVASKPFYHSPRCQIKDSDLFQTTNPLSSPEQRWQHMSEQAGEHKQDGTLFCVNTRFRRMTPKALKSGMPNEAAKRVTRLELNIDDTNTLPEWLDAVGDVFRNLEHLTLKSPPLKRDDDNSKRLRRLYIVYRLPNLKSIDGVAVSCAEQDLARPENHHGLPQQQMRGGGGVPSAGSSSSLLDREDSGCLRDQLSSCSDISLNKQPPNQAAAADATPAMIHLAGNVKQLSISKPTSPSRTARCRDRYSVMEEKKEAENQNVMIKSFPDDFSEVQFESPESSAACEWTCGSLALPYFRDRKQQQGCKTIGPPRLRPRQRSPSREETLDNEHANHHHVTRHFVRLRPMVEKATDRILIPHEADGKEVEVQATFDNVVQSNTSSPEPPPPSYLTLEGGSSTRTAPSRLTIVGPATTKEDPPQKVSPKASLTSPFPMQFRVRAASPPPPPPPGTAPPSAGLPTPMNTGVMAPSSSIIPPPPPSTPPPVKSRRSPSSKKQQQPLGEPVPLTRTHSSPPTLTSSNGAGENRQQTDSRKTLSEKARQLPPPCPGGARRHLVTKPTKKNRIKWRGKRNARSKSLIDHLPDYDDEIDEGDETDDVSDEENVVATR